MLRQAGLVFVVLVAAGALASSSVAGGPPAGLKATVKGNDVKIVNGSSSSAKGFFINSTDSPKITAASNRSCKLGTSPWKDNSGKKHVDYWADCSFSVAAGKSVDVKLATSGHGAIVVWSKTGGNQYKIGTGD